MLGCNSRNSCAGTWLPLRCVTPLFVFLTLSSSFCWAYVAPRIPTSLNRTNFCLRAHAVINGTLPVKNALAGMNVTVAIHYGTPSFYMKISNLTGKPFGGFIYELQNIIAAQGGFNFQYVLVPLHDSSYTDTTWLQKVLPHVDMYGNNWYSDTSDRRSKGMGFMGQLVDASLILVTTQSNSINTGYFGFLRPFSNTVWLCLFCMITFNALMQYAFACDAKRKHRAVSIQEHAIPVERAIDDSEESCTSREDDCQPTVTVAESWYLSFATFTAVGQLDDIIKPASMFLNLGFGFCILMITAAYTANLVSSLVTTPLTATTIQSMDDAVSRGASICAFGAATAYSVLLQYPSINAVKISSNKVPLLLQAIRSGDCDAALMGQIDWLVVQKQASSNPFCNLVQVGDPVRMIPGAWPYKVDFNERCTSLVEMVISELITGITFDATISTQLKSDIEIASDETCSTSGNSGGLVTSASTLRTEDMSGIFILYCTAVAIALCVVVVEATFWRYGWTCSTEGFKRTFHWR